jgi:flagellar basal-body rod protein FlgG
MLIIFPPIKAAELPENENAEPSVNETPNDKPTLDILSLALKNLKTVQAVLANNIANSETTGFKKSRVVLVDNSYHQQTLAGTQDSAGNFTPAGIAVGSGIRVSAVQLDFRQGSLMQTGAELDLAIEGRGFLQVIDPADNTMLYTRAGKLAKNANGQLVVCSSETGRLLEAPIQIPQDALRININPEGQVSVQQPGNNQMQLVGQIQLADFVNSEGLTKIGENLYRENDASGPPTQCNPGQNGHGVLRQGFLESSNVDLDEEILEFKRLNRLCRKIKLLIENE